MPFDQPTFVSFQGVISAAAEVIRDRGMKEIAPSVLRKWASDACQTFARLSETVKKKQYRTLVSEQRLYRVPHDLIKLIRVAVKLPGREDFRMLPFLDEGRLMDDVTRGVAGEPDVCYLARDRKHFGIHPVPPTAGFVGYADNGGASTIVLPVGASTVDDAYKGMDVKILDGAAEGDLRTISGYVGSTRTATVDSAWTAAIVAGVRFEIHPDSIEIEYAAHGNSFLITPTAGTVNGATATYDTIPVSGAAFARPPDYFANCELLFTAGALDGLRTEIVSSTSPASGAVFTVWPELPLKPGNGDAFKVTQIPNIPQGYHQFLADYVIAQVLDRVDPTAARGHMEAFLSAVQAARVGDKPEQRLEYYRVRENAYGEDDWNC